MSKVITGLSVVDLMSLTSREISPEGYLIAPGTMARTGTQDYLASELGLDKSMGLPANKRLTLYRPHEEVGNPESIKSFNAKPIGAILQGPRRGMHPEGNRVTADNWSDVSVGDVHDVKMNGELMQGTLIIRDKEAIDAVQRGMSALSNGYDFDLDLTPGTLSDGTKYDGVQKNIRGNHTMIVDVGRGGYVCKVGDRQREKNMSTKTIAVDGFNLELEPMTADLVKKLVGDRDTNIATLTTEIASLKAKVTAGDAALAAAVEASKTLETTHKAAIDKLTAQVTTPAQVEALAVERTKVIGDAALLVEDFKDAGKSIAQIRSEVLTSVMAGDEALKSIATAVLGGTEPGKDEQITKLAFGAIVAARGTRSNERSTAGYAAIDATARALAGDGKNKDRDVDQKPVGRAAWMANAQDQSRKSADSAPVS